MEIILIKSLKYLNSYLNIKKNRIYRFFFSELDDYFLISATVFLTVLQGRVSSTSFLFIIAWRLGNSNSIIH